MYRIEFTRQAAKALIKAPVATARRIRAKLDVLAKAPFLAYADVKKLAGRSGYRLRLGDWRVIYEIDNGQLILLVIDLGTRGDIYK